MDHCDVDLLVAFRSGDRWAFDVCYERHSRTLAKYAWSRLRSRDLVEEVLQDTFLTAWKKRSRIILVDESLLPWLMVVCRNHVSNMVRRERKHRTYEPVVDAAASFGHGTVWIESAIRNLSDVDQSVVRLCLVEGYSYAQAAALLDTTPSAIGKRLERSRARLRRALSSEQ